MLTAARLQDAFNRTEETQYEKLKEKVRQRIIDSYLYDRVMGAVKEKKPASFAFAVERSMQTYETLDSRELITRFITMRNELAKYAVDSN